MMNDPSHSPAVDSRFETDLVNIEFQLAIADDRLAYDNVFNLLCDLLKRAPSEPRVKELFEQLVQKSPGHLDQVRLAYDKEGLTFDEAVDSLKRLKELDHVGKYDDAIRLGEQLKAEGVKDPDIDMRIQRAKERKREIREQGTVPEIEQVPFEVRTLIAEANSTLRTQDFKQCIEICKRAEKMLDDSFSSIPKELIAIRQEAEYKNDRKVLFDATAKLIEAGRWDAAYQNAQDGMKSFPDELFTDLKRRIENALKEESTLDREIRKLKALPEHVSTLVDYEQAIDNLRGTLTSIGQPTARQIELQNIIGARKKEMTYQFKERGRQSLTLAESSPPEKRTALYEEAIQLIELALKLNPTDQEPNDMLMNARQGLLNIARRSNRNRLVLRGALIFAMLFVIAAVALIGYNAFEQGRTSSLTQTAVVFAGMQTGTQSIIAMQNTGMAVTATQLQSTANAQILALTATVGAANSNAQATMTSRALDFSQAGTNVALTSTAFQLAEDRSATAVIREENRMTQTASFNLTRTAIAPTATPTPVPYRCKGTNSLGGAVLFQGSSYNTEIVAQLPRNAELEIYEFIPSNDNAQGWYKVIYRDSVSGSILRGYTQGKYTLIPSSCFK